MITQGMAVLINYGTYLAPGLLLFGLWFALTPKSLTGMRILILLVAFVLMRDVMTPLGMWSLGSAVQLAFTANTFVLAALGGLSVLLIALLVRVAQTCRHLSSGPRGIARQALRSGSPSGA